MIIKNQDTELWHMNILKEKYFSLQVSDITKDDFQYGGLSGIIVQQLGKTTCNCALIS